MAADRLGRSSALRAPTSSAEETPPELFASGTTVALFGKGRDARSPHRDPERAEGLALRLVALEQYPGVLVEVERRQEMVVHRVKLGEVIARSI